MHIVIFLNPGANSIQNIHISYINPNSFIVIFVIPRVNTFVIPGIDSIYDLQIRYEKFISKNLYFDSLT